MTTDAVEIVRLLFEVVWRLFSSWYIPGTHVTPADFFLFLILAGMGLKFLKSLLGLGGGINDAYVKSMQNYAGSGRGSGAPPVGGGGPPAKL